MKFPSSSASVDQLFDYEDAMEVDSCPGSVIPGLNSPMPGTWPPIDPVPNPTDYSGSNKFGWGIIHDSSFVESMFPAEIDSGFVPEMPPPVRAEPTKVSEHSSPMNTLTNSWSLTNDSSLQSIMDNSPMDEDKMAHLFDFEPADNGFLKQMRDHSAGACTDGDTESNHYDELFVSASLWGPPSPPSKKSEPLVNAVSAHKTTPDSEEKSEPSSKSVSPSSVPTPETSPDTRVKPKEIKISKRPSRPASEGEPHIYELMRIFDETNAVADGNNSKSEGHNIATNLGTEQNYEKFVNDINDAQKNGTAEQSSPKKPALNLLMASNFERGTVSSCASLFEDSDCVSEMQWDDTYSDNSSEAPQNNSGDEPHAAEATDCAMKDCDADAYYSGAQVSHPMGSQPPYCDPQESHFSQSSPKKGPVFSDSGPGLTSVSLQIPDLPKPNSNDAANHSPLAAHRGLPQDNTVLQTHLSDQGAIYTHLPPDSQGFAKNNNNDNGCFDNGTSGLGLSYPVDTYQEWYPQPQAAAPAVNQNQPFEGCDFGTSNQPFENLGFWNMAQNTIQAAPEFAWQMPTDFKTASSAIQPSVVPVQNYQHLDNNTAYNYQYQESNFGSSFPSDSNWAPTGNMAVPSMQPQLQGFSGNSLLDSCSGISYLDSFQQATAPGLPIKTGPSLAFQTPPMATSASLGVMDTFPDELFRDSAKASRVPTAGTASQSNMAEQNFIPRSYFADSNFLEISEPTAAKNTSQPPNEILVDPSFQDLQQFANELDLNMEQQSVEPYQEPQKPPQQPPQQTPVAPVVARAAAATIPINSVFMTSARNNRATRAKQLGPDNVRVSKPKPRNGTGKQTRPIQGTSAQKSNIIRTMVGRAMQELQQTTQNPPVPQEPEQQTTTATVQEQSNSTTTPKPPKAKRERKGKAAFKYDGFNLPQQVLKLPRLQNVSKNEDDQRYKSQLISLNGNGECHIVRTKYQRNNVAELQKAHPNVVYQANEAYGANKPYQYEFCRTELNPLDGTQKIETRSAMCAYCEDINFFELKNSCYSQHMSHSHGIFADSYLTPNPLHSGFYRLSKKASEKRKTQPRIRNREGVVCPVCYDVVEVRCWSSTSEKNPFSNYLRHFKEHHRVEQRKETYFNCLTHPKE